MDNINKQFKKGAKDVCLSVEEKAAMKHALLRHMEANPVRNGVLTRLHSRGANGIPSPFSVNNLRNKKTMPIFLIVGLLMSGSVSFAAENTVPGDILFPVKVHVNENVRSAIVVTPKAQAAWDVQLVERRLQEVEKLASHDKASPKAQEAAKRNLERYMERAKRDIEKFEDEDEGEHAVLTASQLADLLRAHEYVLVGLSLQGATATSTASVATSTMSVATTTTGVVASTTTAINPQMSKESFKDILKLLKESRKDAEKHHKELKHKFKVEDEDDDEHVTFTATTTASVGTTTALIFVPQIKHDDEDDNEESYREDSRKSEKGTSRKAGKRD